MKPHPSAPRRSTTVLLFGRVRLLGWLLVTFWLFAPQLVFGTDRHWTGATNTTWTTNTNWDTGSPSSTDNAVFNSTFSNQPNLFTTNTGVGGLWMTTGVGQNVTISGTTGILTLNGNPINGTAGLGILID